MDSRGFYALGIPSGIRKEINGMKKCQMKKLKPGEILVDKETGDEFIFVRLAEVVSLKVFEDLYKKDNTHTEIVVRQIRGWKYKYSYGCHPEVYFRHTRLKLKEEMR